jgi:hypothetical protein
MLKKSASFDSPAALLGTRRVLARWGWAGEKADLFEHPAGRIPVMQNVQIDQIPACLQNISIAY